MGDESSLHFMEASGKPGVDTDAARFERMLEVSEERFIDRDHPFNAATGMISPRRPRGSMAGFARPMCRFKHCLSDQQSFSRPQGLSAARRRFILNRRIPRQICAARDFSKIMKQKVVEFRREADGQNFCASPFVRIAE
ncbi:MAG: hypothetical protein R3D33_11485 [Hyphomicrobiaceae bacterium]